MERVQAAVDHAAHGDANVPVLLDECFKAAEIHGPRRFMMIPSKVETLEHFNPLLGQVTVLAFTHSFTLVADAFHLNKKTM